LLVTEATDTKQNELAMADCGIARLGIVSNL
jgi:hypothetical protein